MVRNPVIPSRISRIALSPDQVDCIVFWTKHPAGLLPYVREIGDMGYHLYVQMTLNSYGPEIEPDTADFDRRIDDAKRLADKLGPKGVVWRYDPILLQPPYDVSFHQDAFVRTVGLLSGSVDTCTVSLVDVYRKLAGRIREPERRETAALLPLLAEAAGSFGMDIVSCAEPEDLTSFGIQPGRCIDPERIRRITGKPSDQRKDRSQRKACGCAASVDIGAYRSCTSRCLYCYASPVQHADHDAQAPVLIGNIRPGDRISSRS